jgi:uncharacterized SAM-binding protein YcdF (DUF218 family)
MVQSSRLRKILTRISLAIPPILILAWLFAVMAIIEGFGSKDWLSYNPERSPRQVDAILVFGAGVDYDRPSPVFEARLRHAVDLYQSGVAPVLIFTGGLGSGDLLAEGPVGRDYAVAHGVPPEAILLEDRSRTTLQNLAEAKRELAGAGVGQRVALVSDPHHLLRASLMANEVGLISWSSPTPHTRYRSISSRFPALLREVYFLHHFVAFRR